MHRIKFWFILFWAIGLVLSGCSGKQEATSGRLESVGEKPTPTETQFNANTPTSQDDIPPVALTEAIDAPGVFIYTTRAGLFRWDFSTNNKPELIANNAIPDMFYLSQDHATLLFASQSATGSEFTLNKYDLNTREITPLYSGRASRNGFYWALDSWSPDNQWVLFQIASRDGNFFLVPMNPNQETYPIDGDFPRPYWTDDNRVVFISIDMVGFRPTSSDQLPPIEKVELINLADGTRQDYFDQLDMESIAEITDYAERDQAIREALATLGIHVTDPYQQYLNSLSDNSVYWAEWIDANYDYNAPAQYCHTWAIVKGTATGDTPETVHQTDEVALIQDINTLDDDSLLFVQFQYPDCKFGTPVGELVHMHDGQLDILANTLASAQDTNTFRGYVSGIRYVVSPDGHYVMWLAQDEYGLENQVMTMALDKQMEEPLMVDGEPLKDVAHMMWIDLAD